jgi:hypothetical protein
MANLSGRNEPNDALAARVCPPPKRKMHAVQCTLMIITQVLKLLSPSSLTETLVIDYLGNN